MSQQNLPVQLIYASKNVKKKNNKQPFMAELLAIAPNCKQPQTQQYYVWTVKLNSSHNGKKPCNNDNTQTTESAT
jgi:hypothetical protein